MKEKQQNIHTNNNITKFGIDYSIAEQQTFKKIYEQNIKPRVIDQVITGSVVFITDQYTIVNVGLKSDGIIALSDLRDMPNLKIGDEIEVYVEEEEDKKGQITISRKKAILLKTLQLIEKSFENSIVLEALVKQKTRGGLIVDIDGIEAFLPGSQIDVKPVRDFDIFIGKTIDIVVIKIAQQTTKNNSVIVSHKAVLEKGLEAQKAGIINKLIKGQVVEGIVKNMTNFGVFVELGGVDGLLHITDISWERINHPSEVLTLGQKIQVVITDFEEERQRISLGMKQLTANPWDTLSADIQVGTIITGKVIKVVDYGVFVTISPGVEGLMHISETSWSQQIKKPDDILHIGDEVTAKILTLDKAERRISLSMKQLTPDPWEQEYLTKKYAIGTKHQCVIKVITHYGALVELETGIDGLLHIADLSWTRRITNLDDILKIGQKIELVVIELDKANRRIFLGLKQLSENPWENCEELLKVGSIHQGTIIRKIDKGVFVQLPNQIEGFMPKRYLNKEQTINSELQCEVIEFSKLNKRIIVVPQGTYNDAENKTPKNKVLGKEKNTDNTYKSTITTTLSEMEELTALKAQLNLHATKDKTATIKQTEIENSN
jgi:small subunit ribosomal protein S1